MSWLYRSCLELEFDTTKLRPRLRHVFPRSRHELSSLRLLQRSLLLHDKNHILLLGLAQKESAVEVILESLVMRALVNVQ